MNEKLVLWMVTAMLRWNPIASGEKEEEAKARYAAIATDAAAIAFDEGERPLFRGPLGRTKTAALLLSVASFESGFREDVENGKRRGDGGRSWCLMQINLGAGRIRVEGVANGAYEYAPATDETAWSGRDLAADRRKCFRAALHVARVSFRACGDLGVYASGRCEKNLPAVENRQNRAKSMFLPNVKPEWETDAALALTL